MRPEETDDIMRELVVLMGKRERLDRQRRMCVDDTERAKSFDKVLAFIDRDIRTLNHRMEAARQREKGTKK